jgi:hypothetical protein
VWRASLVAFVCAGLLVAACGQPSESRLELARAGLAITCSDATALEFTTIQTAEGRRQGIRQPPSTGCSIPLDVPAGSRLHFRVALDAEDYMKGREARARVVAGEREVVRELSLLHPVGLAAVRLQAGAQTVRLEADPLGDPESAAGVTWADLEVRVPVANPGPGWIVAPALASAPFLAGLEAGARTGPRLLVIGVDGGSWPPLRVLLEDGELPTLAALRERGRWGTLRSSTVPSRESSWNALVTGGAGGGRAFWDVAAEHGRTPLLVAVPGARVEGPGLRIVEARDGAWVQPDAFEAPLARAGFLREPVALRHRGRVLDQMDRRSRVASALLRAVEWDLAFFVFRHTDASTRLFSLYGRGWLDAQRAFDAGLARLLEAVDEETTVLLVSSHGWRYYERTLRLNAWLADEQLLDWRAGLPAAGNVATVERGGPGHREGRKLEGRLRALRDPVSGDPVIRAIRRTAEGLTVEAEPRYAIDIGHGGRRAFRGGIDGPTREGLYLLVGPGVPAGEGPERSIHDVAPSVLTLLGIDVPADLEGKAFPEVAAGLRENER